MLRVTIGGSFALKGGIPGYPFAKRVATVGQRWQGRGTAFTQTKTRLNGTLLGCWEPGHDQPWLILTDVPPQAADACGYGLRAYPTRLQTDEERRVAMAIYPHDRSHPGRAPWVGDHHRNVVVVIRRW